MVPKNILFGGGASGTVLHPLVAAAMAVAIILILCLQRKYVIVPLLFGLFFIPKGQEILVAGVHFTVARILILAGLARCAVSGRSSRLAGGFNSIDRYFALWAVSYLLIYSLQLIEAQAFVKHIADFMDAMGGYFVLRFLIHDREDIMRAVKTLGAVAAIMAVFMINEQMTRSNLFTRLGGMPGTTVRDGKIRSQGAFEVFITAGAYGATLIPLLIWLWSQAKCRLLSALGIIGATVMTVTCYASTTLGAYAAGIFALCLWPLRKRMRLVRWGIVAALLSLQLVMNGPVWSLIEKVDLTGSSSSYHRYMLVDNTIRHFGEWWLLGYKNYNEWGWDMWDLSDQYVAYAVSGGLLTLLLFIGIISRSFGTLGNARKAVEGDRKEEWFLWCLGSALLAHVTGFFGIGYFDQMQFAWYVLLAIICAAAAAAARSRPADAEQALEPAYQAYVADWGALQETP